MEEIINNEKISINMNVTDLGYMDLLIEQGFFSNRTDFIKTAVRNEIDKRKDVLQHTIDRKSEEKRLSIGIRRISNKEVQEIINRKQKQALLVVGMLVIDKEITLSDLSNAYSSVEVYGVLKATPDIKRYYIQ